MRSPQKDIGAIINGNDAMMIQFVRSLRQRTDADKIRQTFRWVGLNSRSGRLGLSYCYSENKNGADVFEKGPTAP